MPPKRQIASSARLIALNSMCVTACSKAAKPSVVKGERKVGTPHALRAVEILEVILRDEIGHVAIGNRWYRALCTQRGLEPVATYALLAAQYGAPRIKGPLNLSARRHAGFDAAELELLCLQA